MPLASPFDPLSIAGCMGWWDLSDSRTVTLVSGGADTVSDKSGNGRTLTATGTARPTPTNVGGKQGLRFIGASGNCLATGVFTQAQPATGFAVVKQQTLSGTFKSIVGTDQTVHGPDFAVDNNTWGLGTIIAGIDTTPEDLLPHVFSYVFNGASSSVWADGVLLGSGDVGATGWASSKIVLGGEVNPETLNFDGSIGEVIYYNSALSTANRVAVEQYLTMKWLKRRTMSVSEVGGTN